MTFKEALSIFSKTNTTKNKEDISWLVWLIENPKSPFHLHGAVTLRDHDHIHVLLGRGQANDDEAFVIGFTMGNDGNQNYLNSFPVGSILNRNDLLKSS